MEPLPENQIAFKSRSTSLNGKFAEKAESLIPQLHEKIVPALSVVRFEQDEELYFKLRLVQSYGIAELNTVKWRGGEDFILDFGHHVVGYLSFFLDAEGVNVDAPTRLRLVFGENPLDVTEDLQPCRSWISSSWIPEETITVDWLPTHVNLPRRYSFRYLRITVVDTSPKYRVKFSNVKVRAVSSANPDAHLLPFKHEDKLLEAIDRVSIATMTDCMQTVFEDGPRRDRRLWIGDLRLQALTNYSTFGDFKLVRRCLYLFAAVASEDGSLPASLFEKPKLAPASDYIVDYDLLYGSIVHDYVKESGDIKTGHELWETVLGSVKIGLAHVNEEYVFSCQKLPFWKFLDWEEKLDRDAGMHGLLIYSLKAINALAHILAKDPPFLHEVKFLVDAAQKFYDRERGVFVSGQYGQVSWASQAWMGISEVMDPDICKRALLTAMHDPHALRPLTPYLYHYVAEALFTVGAKEECLKLIRDYWGAMVAAGADTFWECFDPNDCRASPYGDCHNNSYCHAWSCTPAYLLRKLFP
ncbi:uncharacterized protein PV09_07795 [Verruconis gallopava]|uniref:Uncharacterized protein n=1 Tax=Verruconis gallopava TaxID=253628 RepID=A0A0D1YID0_9PEZI|nr:uncharacterized protein PV09_07795 [Verruconis gallopava]KIW00597.1 hypothetical protein PV09_07795 [Verruconis gallopava]